MLVWKRPKINEKEPRMCIFFKKIALICLNFAQKEHTTFFKGCFHKTSLKVTKFTGYFCTKNVLTLMPRLRTILENGLAKIHLWINWKNRLLITNCNASEACFTHQLSKVFGEFFGLSAYLLYISTKSCVILLNKNCRRLESKTFKHLVEWGSDQASQ